jgi:hypothetical protein
MSVQIASPNDTSHTRLTTLDTEAAIYKSISSSTTGKYALKILTEYFVTLLQCCT